MKVKVDIFNDYVQIMLVTSFSLCPAWGGKYCNQCVCMSMFVCLFVCLSSCVSQKPHVQTWRNFLYSLTVAVTGSASDNNAIRYLLLWMTSYVT